MEVSLCYKVNCKLHIHVMEWDCTTRLLCNTCQQWKGNEYITYIQREINESNTDIPLLPNGAVGCASRPERLKFNHTTIYLYAFVNTNVICLTLCYTPVIDSANKRQTGFFLSPSGGFRSISANSFVTQLYRGQLCRKWESNQTAWLLCDHKLR